MSKKFSDLHLQIKIEAMKETGEKGKHIKHFKY